MDSRRTRVSGPESKSDWLEFLVAIEVTLEMLQKYYLLVDSSWVIEKVMLFHYLFMS
jgi:hypothetical protein